MHNGLERIKQPEHLANELRRRIEPLADSIITQFDSHVASLQDHAASVRYLNTTEMLPGATGSTSRPNSQLRAVTIGNVELFLDMFPAQVDDTGHVDNANRILTLHDRPALPDFTAQLDDPAQNADLRRAIGRALDDVFTNAVLRITDLPEESH